MDVRFPLLDQGAVEALLKRDSLPVRSECDVLRIALMYYFRRDGEQVNAQSLLNVVRYNCGNETLIRVSDKIRQDFLNYKRLLRICIIDCNCDLYEVLKTEHLEMLSRT